MLLHRNFFKILAIASHNTLQIAQTEQPRWLSLLTQLNTFFLFLVSYCRSAVLEHISLLFCIICNSCQIVACATGWQKHASRKAISPSEAEKRCSDLRSQFATGLAGLIQSFHARKNKLILLSCMVFYYLRVPLCNMCRQTCFHPYCVLSRLRHDSASTQKHATPAHYSGHPDG
jgi:hypothetical protein